MMLMGWSIRRTSGSGGNGKGEIELMFQILFDGLLIGYSELENGDPPMGCAEGNFFPSADFEQFVSNKLPENDQDTAVKRWFGLSAITPGGEQIECLDVVLFEYDYGSEKEFLVDVIAISYPLYETLFPGRYAAYEASFK